MRHSLTKYLLKKLPQIQKWAAEGIEQGVMCDRLHCSRPTLRVFLKQHGIVLPKAWKRTTPAKPPSDWPGFIPNHEPSPLTHAELKLRTMDDMSAQELAAIQARLQARQTQPVKRWRLTSDDEVSPW